LYAIILGDVLNYTAHLATWHLTFLVSIGTATVVTEITYSRVGHYFQGTERQRKRQRERDRETERDVYRERERRTDKNGAPMRVTLLSRSSTFVLANYSRVSPSGNYFVNPNVLSGDRHGRTRGPLRKIIKTSLGLVTARYRFTGPSIYRIWNR